MKPVTTLLAAACTALLLAGCASTPDTPPVVKAQVRSVAAAGDVLRAGVRYRFEHLPLQQDTEISQQVHALAQDALAAAGLVRDDATALVSVQVQASSAVDWIYDEWAPYRSRFYWGLGFGGRRGGIMFGGPFGWDAPRPIYINQAGFIMRAVNGGQVLYETHARNSSARAPGQETIAALFAAALQGFPTPPEGVRNVAIPLEAPPPTQGGVPFAPAPLPAASAP